MIFKTFMISPFDPQTLLIFDTFYKFSKYDIKMETKTGLKRWILVHFIVTQIVNLRF